MPVGILPVGTVPCTRNTGRPGKYGTVGILATLVTLCINDVIATRDFCTRVRAVAQNSPPIDSNWYYVILNSFKIARWSGWVWVGECFFWYRPTRVVPDQRPLNGRCCCCCFSRRVKLKTFRRRTLCPIKRHRCRTLLLRRTSTDFDNFWRICSWERMLSNRNFIFHVT